MPASALPFFAQIIDAGSLGLARTSAVLNVAEGSYSRGKNKGARYH